MDRAIFDPESDSAKRMRAYGEFVDTLSIVVFAPRGKFQKTALSPRVTVYPTNSFHRFWYMRNAERIGKKIAGEKGCALVIAQNPFETGRPAIRVARSVHAKVLLEVHTDFLNPYFKDEGFLNRIRVRMAEKNLPQADCIRVVSDRIKNDLEETFPALASRIKVLPVFTAEAIASEGRDVRAEYPNFNPLILSVARLEREKNVGLALRVLARISGTFPQAGLVVVGDGSMRGHLQSEARRLGIDTRVVFAGQQADVSSYYRAADMLLATSNYEGYGRMFVEAAREERPIVTTDVGIARNILIEPDKHFICPVGDVQCLSDQVLMLAKSSELRREVGMRCMGAVAAVTSTNWDEYLRAYKELWEDCAKT